MDDYIDKIAVPQVSEILTNYGGLPGRALVGHARRDMNKERAEKLYQGRPGTHARTSS